MRVELSLMPHLKRGTHSSKEEGLPYWHIDFQNDQPILDLDLDLVRVEDLDLDLD